MGATLVRLFAYPSSDHQDLDIAWNTLTLCFDIAGLSYLSYIDSMSGHPPRDPPKSFLELSKTKDWAWIGCLLVIFVLQIILAGLFHTEGFSLCWSALSGWICSTIHQRKYRKTLLYVSIVLLVANLAIFLYYIFTAEVVTTVAHLCGIIFGVLSGLVVLDKSQRRTLAYFDEVDLLFEED